MTKLPPLPKLQMSRLLKLGEKSKSVIFLIVLALAIAANLLIQPFGFRLDLSKNQAYTLSDSSKKIIRNLDNKTKLTLYISKDLPTRLAPFRRDIIDLLNEYQRAGGGNVTVEVKDPKTDEKARENAIKNGINEVRFSQLDQDKFNVSTGYLGLLVSYNGQDRALPQITDLSNLEYNITSTMYMLASKETPKVGVIGNFTGLDQQSADPIGALRQTLSQQFELQSVSLISPPSEGMGESPDIPTPTPAVIDIDPTIKTLLLMDTPPKKYSDQEISKIKDFLNKKGKVIAFLNGVQVNEQLIATEEATSNLFGLTREYGITVNKDLVLSTDAELINFGSGVTQFYIPYPLWLKTNTFNKQTGYFSNVNQLTFPWASSLSLESKPGFDVTDIIKTNERSWRQTGNFVLDPQKTANNLPTTFEQFTIGATSTNKNGGVLMVLPSSRFAVNNYLSQESGNLNFLLNVVNSFASDGALAGIRQRAVDIYPLPTLSSSEQNVFKYATMLILPLMFAAFGAYYIWKRR